MARQRRIELPNVIYHVMTRGWNRAAIFKDRADRIEFLKRLSENLIKTSTHCYAWALMDNHVHLLLKPTSDPLSRVMRKLLTGYAIYFNHRHHRCGYLFQNRYKSVLCQKDNYFLELIRYIHLNPVRAGIVQSQNELDKYPWTGHLALTQGKQNMWQSVKAVLREFGQPKGEAIKRYRQFIQDGWSVEKRKDLTGGGIKRSAGGWGGMLALKSQGEKWRGDERILGEGDFVETILEKAKEEFEKKEKIRQAGWDMEKLTARVCQLLAVDPKEILRRGKYSKVSQVRAVICYWGYIDLGFSGVEMSKFLGISKASVSEAMARGSRIIQEKRLNLTT
jgi:putative transposase